ATGVRQKRVRTEKHAFQVQHGDQSQSIYILTAIRIPTDSALLTRIWFFNYDKQHFGVDFGDEMAVRQQILDNRDSLLSFWLHLLSQTLKLQAQNGWPNLSDHEPLPAHRTRMAQSILLQCLHAYEQLSPGIFNPEEEFRGFLEQQRSEDAT